ncbi:dipeptidase PepV [Bacillus sp. Marseille-P3661]|uniref:dipeptidase PepV n=1 Tax=Bacillus sp. Marseille-P3661 TaxID=1936234 RepID=UPI000C81997D|nr:dipeptidase PepV [Bacillus sp. Marseille-P3661]
MSSKINWIEEVQKRKESIIQDTQKFLQIKSVLDEEHTTPSAPLGEGIRRALEFMLEKGEQDGFIVKNVDGLAGHIEYGKGTSLLGILCHVDVVPEGDGWTSAPYSAEIRDGKIFARGAIDDKGPTMAAYYAMKIVKELGVPIEKRIRIILGTDEESDWRCVEHYFKHEEMPTIGFAPDADFPIIHAEKGIFDFEFHQNNELNIEPTIGVTLLNFAAGRRLNMVPDLAEAILVDKSGTQGLNEIRQLFETYLQEQNLKGKAVIDNETQLSIRLEGISAHGMEPNNGKNAGLLLIQFLQTVNVDARGNTYISFVNQYFGQDTRGIALGINDSDDISGELTINSGLFRYSRNEGGSIGLNLRYPVRHDIDATKQKLKEIAENHSFTFKELNDSKPHHVDKNHPLINSLIKVYEEQTHEKAELIAIGGGTYARSLAAGVAFGPLFPGRPDVAHQRDEYIEIEDLLKATAIYAQAIFELAKEDK